MSAGEKGEEAYNVPGDGVEGDVGDRVKELLVPHDKMEHLDGGRHDEPLQVSKDLDHRATQVRN